MNTKKTLASNQSILWSYYNVLRSLVFENKKATNSNEKRENALLVIIMSITIIEAFLNIYFYLLVSEEKYFKHSEQISKEIKNTSFSLDKKIRLWPKLLFNKDIDLGRGVGQMFQELKKLRNKLLHFHSDHFKSEFNNIKITKLLDISAFEKLAEYDVNSCTSIVLDFASEIFRLSGVPDNKIDSAIHVWFGDVSRRKI
jgi:hypothetical protein